MKSFYLLVISAVIISCSKTGPHTAKGGFKYIVHSTSDKRKAVKGDVLQLRFTYTTENDSVLFSSDAMSDSTIMEYTDLKYGEMTEALGLMGEGDSITFIFSPDSVFQKVFNAKTPDYFTKESKINWNVKLQKLFTREEFTRTIDNRLRQSSAEEDQQIKSYCIANEILVEPTASGLVYVPLKDGEGQPARIGDSIEVKYTARFLSGQIFDSSEDGSGVVRFELGKSRMIKGWEEGFLYVKEKGIGRFIIPSRLAYGIKGYGPVPGDTPLVYDVELVKIISRKPL
jgi:FKBP-type peptidyl-prolyl cis-trans isomerase FkpA